MPTPFPVTREYCKTLLSFQQSATITLKGPHTLLHGESNEGPAGCPQRIPP